MLDFLPFSRPSLGEEEIAAVNSVMLSGWITSGPKNQQLEAAFRALTGNKHAIAVSSAAGRMHLALMALDISPGDEVITPSLTWVSTLNMIVSLGAVPVMVDVDRDTLMVTRRPLLRPSHRARVPLFQCIMLARQLVWMRFVPLGTVTVFPLSKMLHMPLGRNIVVLPLARRARRFSPFMPSKI